MLSIKQQLLLNEITQELNNESADDFIKTIILSYANSTKRISTLLKFIPELSSTQMNLMQEKINNYSWSTDLLIADRYINKTKKHRSRDLNHDFALLLYVCKSHFQRGNCDGDSKACIDLFNEFIDMLKLKDKKIFDYTDKDDWHWVKTTANCDEWLEKVIQLNIDSEFKKPIL